MSVSSYSYPRDTDRVKRAPALTIKEVALALGITYQALTARMSAYPEGVPMPVLNGRRRKCMYHLSDFRRWWSSTKGN